MNATQRTALDLTATGRLSTPRLARVAGVSLMDAARAIGDLEMAGLVINYGGTYALRRPTR